MPFFTTSSAPPDAAPEMTLISLPFEVCQALMAGFGPDVGGVQLAGQQRGGLLGTGAERA